MYYELTGELKALAFAYSEKSKQWHLAVLDAISCFGATGYYVWGHPLCGYSVGAVAFSDGAIAKGWKQSKACDGYTPDQRTKAGREASNLLKALDRQPLPVDLYEAIGVTLPIGSGPGSVCIPGHSISKKDNYAVLHWSEKFPEINHPLATEITTRQYKALTRLEVAA